MRNLLLLNCRKELGSVKKSLWSSFQLESQMKLKFLKFSRLPFSVFSL